MSIIADFRSLPPASQHFLLFSGINLISWQCIIGQMLALFGRDIGMPSSWVGILLSFMPLSMLLVILSIPLVETYGPRKMMIITWLGRNLSAIPVLFIPLAMGIWGPKAAWYILSLATLCFSLVRSFGVGAWFPWLHELIPQDKLGTFFSIETTWVQSLNVLVTFGISRILSMQENPYRFYWVYAVGITAGLISVWYIIRMSGGARNSTAESTSEKFSVIVHAFRDSRFRNFIILSVLSISAIMWLNFSSILYLRDVLKFPDNRIMFFMTAGAIGVALSIHTTGKFAEKFRSNHVIAFLMGGFAIIATCWCGLRPEIQWTLKFTLPIIVLGAIISAEFFVFASKGMMSLVQEKDRTGYTSMWIVGTSLSNGIPPIIAGWLISIFHTQGYRICFLISAISAFAVAVFWRRFHLDTVELITDAHMIIKPTQPLRSLQRLAWMVRRLKRDNNSEDQ